jgi:Domain of unknown function (DUF4263)
MSQTIRSRSTSARTSRLDPIVLREGPESRLVFVPTLVVNEKEPRAGINGDFVYQKKARNAVWIDFRTIPLTSLKTGEGYVLSLKSAELLALYEQLQTAYDFRKQKGTPKGQRTWIDATQLGGLGKINYPAVADFLDSGSDNAESFMVKVVRWLATSPQAVGTVQRIMDSGQLPDLNARIGLASLKATLEIWKSNQSNNDEAHWQELLEDRAYILSQALSFPLVIIRNKPYLGGKKLDNKGGKYSDFLAANALTRSAVIVEIKTPLTPLLSGGYRDDVYPFSDELSGAIAQVLQQRRTFLNETQLHREISTAGICCVVLAGNIQRQLPDATMRENFDLQRESLHGVIVLSYDELFRKIEDLIDLVELPGSRKP